MLTEDPKVQYRMGLAALRVNRPGVAAEHFRTAIAAEKRRGVVRPQMRYLSYFGLSMALANRARHPAVSLCENAATTDPFDPVLQLNLGRAYLKTQRRTKAIQAFAEGLKIDPLNTQLREAFAAADRRRRPPLPWLGRDHPLNRSLGRLRASWTRPRR